MKWTTLASTIYLLSYGCTLPDAHWSVKLITHDEIDLACMTSVFNKTIPSDSENRMIESSDREIAPTWSKVNHTWIGRTHDSLGQKVSFLFSIQITETMKTKEKEVWLNVKLSNKNGSPTLQLSTEEVKNIKTEGRESIQLIKSMLSEFEKVCHLKYDPATLKTECHAELCEEKTN